MTAPVAIKRIEPDFSACKAGRYSGVPVAEAIVTSEGSVRDVRIVKSVAPCIDNAVVAAVRQWKFRPATLKGRPVDVVFNFTVFIDYK